MGVSLMDVAEQLKNAKHKTKAKEASESDVRVQLIYAFNGTGKTRLSREFKELVAPKAVDEDKDIEELIGKKHPILQCFY